MTPMSILKVCKVYQNC